MMAKAAKEVEVPELLEVEMELFRRRSFRFVTESDGKRHWKQDEALVVLTDDDHAEVLYGGAAGGAKTWTGAAWEMFMSLCYPGTKWFIGRATLTEITKSTFLTFKRVASRYGCGGDLYKFNGQNNYIEFFNGSRIDFLDLRYIPSDPLYERYGSLEFTGGWIEEGGEVHFGAYDTLKTRVGRCLNAEYGLKRKLFITCNPKKNWMYEEFYKPWKASRLPDYKAYLPCLVQENPFIDPDYIEGLRTTSDKVKRERLLKGNWEYDDNPDALCAHDDIVAIFGNVLALDSPKHYLTADIARFGADYARILVWRGWRVVDVRSFPVSRTTDIQDYIRRCQSRYRIPCNRCIADEDGVGGGVVDNCGIQGFVNNSAALAGENYYNLQTQCGYRLAERINASEVGIDPDIVTGEEKEEITLELEQLQTWRSDSDGKLMLKPKAEIKIDLGRSPDWRDALLMRCWFDYNEYDVPDDIERRLGIYNDL